MLDLGRLALSYPPLNLTSFLGQDKGHLHVHPPFDDLAVLDQTLDVLDPGAFDLIQGCICPGNATLHRVFNALASTMTSAR